MLISLFKLSSSKLRANKSHPWPRVARSIMVFPPDAKPARKECNRRGLFSTGGCHVNKMALQILCVLSKTRQQKWALFRSIRISSAHRRTRALRLICSCPYSLTSITHGDSSHTPQYKHFTVSSEIWRSKRHSKLHWAQWRSTVTMPVVPKQHKARWNQALCSRPCCAAARRPARDQSNNENVQLCTFTLQLAKSFKLTAKSSKNWRRIGWANNFDCLW